MQSDQQAGYIELEDSLRLVLSNKNAGLNTGYSWGTKKIKHSVNLNLNSSTFANINEEYFVPIGESKNKNINLSYRLRHKPSGMRYSFGTNYYTLNSEKNSSSGLGLNAGISKVLLKKKLVVNIKTSINKRKVNDIDDGIHFRLKNRISYKLSKKQKLAFYISWSKRPSISKRPLNETRAHLSYNLNF